MRRRAMKLAALAAVGGVMLQVAGCGTVIVQLVAQNVLSAVLSALLSGLLGGTGDEMMP